MTKKSLLSLISWSLVLSCLAPRALADTPPAPASASASGIPGWDEFVEGLRALPDQMLAKLPPDERDDPQIRGEVGRLMLAAVASSALEVLNGDGDHPAFVPSLGQVLNLARPNADTIYRVTEITPGGTYRLRGRRGTLRIVKIGAVAPKAGSAAVYYDVNALHADRDGRYDVILSPERPAGYQGDWWQLAPAATQLLLRMISDDWSKEQDPTFSIERLDRPVVRPRPSAAELEQRLRSLPKAISFIAGYRMGRITELRQQGYLNKPNVVEIAKTGALVGQFYYEAAYDLKDNEALIVEAKEPDKCVYRSIILTTEMGETVDWTDNETSLNDAQAKPDKDGVIRIVISAKDPGVPNWLDTAGYLQGGIQGRWTDCSSQPIPSMLKVAFTDVRKSLPPETAIVTPEQRESLIRGRRAAFQQRPLW